MRCQDCQWADEDIMTLGRDEPIKSVEVLVEPCEAHKDELDFDYDTFMAAWARFGDELSASIARIADAFAEAARSMRKERVQSDLTLSPPEEDK